MKSGEKIGTPHRKILGLIPAGGQATRIGPLPFSKELYPVGFHQVDQGGGLRPKVVSHYLLEKMRLADVSKVYIILRKGKWDIPAYLGDGKILDMHLAYLIMNLPFGVPYTLDQAYPFVKDAIVVFGFPDIIFRPDDAFVRLLNRQAESSADIVLGLFPAHQPHKMDMVALNADGRINGIQIKPVQTHLRYTWIIAVWSSRFTEFIHEYVLTNQRTFIPHTTSNNLEGEQELFLGNVIQAAIINNIMVDTVTFSNGNYLDIGTPEDIVKASQIIHQVSGNG